MDIIQMDDMNPEWLPEVRYEYRYKTLKGDGYSLKDLSHKISEFKWSPWTRMKLHEYASKYGVSVYDMEKREVR